MKRNSKGFFFTIVIFLLITYILSSTSIWVKTVQESEKKFSDELRKSNLELIASQLNDLEITKFSLLSVQNALFALNTQTAVTPVKQDPSDEFYHVNNAMIQLIENGSATSDNFVLSQQAVSSVSSSSSFSGWFNQVNTSISGLGFRIKSYKLNNFKINQSRMDNINYSFNISVVIDDRTTELSIERNYTINGTVNISGFTDPAINRLIVPSPNVKVEKQYFFYDDYNTPAAIAPRSILTANEGQGWFYGPLVSVTKANTIATQDRNRYILVGGYQQVISLVGQSVDYAQFGAIILTSSPTLSQSACSGNSNEADTLNALSFNSLCAATASGSYAKPFAVSPGFAISNMPSCPEGNCVIFVSSHNPVQVTASPALKLNPVSFYDMEAIRDFAICGYYTKNSNSPSFLQRMLESPYSKKSDNFGIETFIVSNFIGGTSVGNIQATSIYPDSTSRIDKDIFNSVSGFKIRGMPGCKNLESCSSASPIGHFSLSPDGISRYILASTLSCNYGNANCG
ncbi:MAG: hypothetical protein AABX38_05580 [Candidatus Micrarchaeota archaeon]